MHSPDRKLRICVLGDSHIVALRRALSRDHSGFEDLEIKLVAAARDGMRDVTLQGTLLQATSEKVAGQFVRTTGGDSFVDLEAFDVFAVCGLGLSLQSLFAIYNSHQPYGMQISGQGARLISDSALRAAIHNGVQASLAITMVGLIRSVSTKPILVIPQPSPAASIVQLRSKWPWIDKPGAGALVKHLRVLLNETISKISGESGAHALLQLAATVDESGFSHEQYHQPGKDGDAAHMNADYGLLVLQQLKEAVAAHVPPLARREPSARIN